jgi:glycosyltransferase involved in cell wall biosynthesis
MNETAPLVSVIIPYFNAAETILRTLQSIAESTYENLEIIAVNDGSQDDSVKIAVEHPGRHISMIQRSGAAVARNVGAAAASGSILFFVDADVTVQPETIRLMVDTFHSEPSLDACFGEYTVYPYHGNFATVYKNLVHHFTHQTSREEAQTFWAGCGAVKAEPFAQVGGFDESFAAASVEDIDLGYRLKEAGKRILLNKQLQVTHGKPYTLLSLIRSDLFDRAIPWTKLMARRNVFTADLNLRWTNVVSGLLLFLGPPLVAAFAFTFGTEQLWMPALMGLLLYLVLNGPIFGFVMRHKGPLFFIPFFLMYTITYVYSCIGFGLGILGYAVDGIRGKTRGASSQ